MKLVLAFPILILAGCTSPSLQGMFSPSDATPAAATTAVTPQARPTTLDTTPPPPPPAGARTVEQFDTTSQESRAAAVVVEKPAGEIRLGTTIASLGSPADPGIWLKTPLVKELSQGRVEYTANGKTVNLELRPSGGSAGSGSQISLAAMRLLEAPLTGLPELIVFKK